MSVPAIAVASLSPRPPRGAPIVVLGPSLGTSAAALWGRCAALLGERLDVLAWELPGHGEGAPARAPFSLSELAEGVIIAVERSLAERGHARAAFAYAGVSVGGAVGLQLLLSHPERVTAATLLGTGARIGTTAGWHDRAAEVRLRGTASIVDASAGRWFAPGFLDREPDAAAALLRALTDADRDSYAWTCEALADFDVRARLAAIAAPVTAVAGAHDQATPVASLREIADGVRDGRLFVLDDVSHLAPAEAPAAVADLILDRPRRAAELDVAGMAVRRAVLGDDYVDRAVADTTDFTQEFQDFITRYAWGSVWARPGLDRRSRSLVTLTALVAGGHHEELAMHVRAARTNGLTVDEIKECLLQTAIYCGVPAANAAFRIAARVLAQGGGDA